MAQSIHSILIITKAGQAQACDLGQEISGWLALRGVSCTAVVDESLEWDALLDGTGYDMVLVLGGDGTILRVAGKIAGRGLPILGLNLGRVGFLTETSPEDWRPFLEDLLEKGIEAAERLALKFEVVRGEETVHKGRVVNDLVVNRGALARLIRLGLGLNNDPPAGVRADGLVIATPIGSTAYSVSSGGPVIHPALHVFSVTPICPLQRGFRPMVLPGDARLTIHVQESSEVYLTLDGQSCFRVFEGDRVHVTGAKRGVFFVKPGKPSYFQKLKSKGFVGERP